MVLMVIEIQLFRSLKFWSIFYVLHLGCPRERNSNQIIELFNILHFAGTFCIFYETELIKRKLAVLISRY